MTFQTSASSKMNQACTQDFRMGGYIEYGIVVCYAARGWGMGGGCVPANVKRGSSGFLATG